MAGDWEDEESHYDALKADNERLRAALIKVNEHIRQGETAEAGVEIDLALNGGDDG